MLVYQRVYIYVCVICVWIDDLEIIFHITDFSITQIGWFTVFEVPVLAEVARNYVESDRLQIRKKTTNIKSM